MGHCQANVKDVLSENDQAMFVLFSEIENTWYDLMEG